MKMVAAPAADALQVSSRAWLKWMWFPVIFVPLATGLWWLGHPADLATTDSTVSVTTKAGQPIYLAVVGTSDDGRRSLEVDEVKVPINAPRDHSGTKTESWICKGGSIAQTTDPSRFCAEVVRAAGNTLHLGGGDQLMISVSADDSATLEIGRPEITFREGLQRGTLPAGSAYSIKMLD